METIEKIVYRHPFWKRLNPDYFHILEECASHVRFGMGQPIFQADSEAEYFYLIDPLPKNWRTLSISPTSPRPWAAGPAPRSLRLAARVSINVVRLTAKLRHIPLHP